MMSKPQLKTSIYLDPDILAIIAEREVGPGTRSEVIRACVERYAEICRRHRPELNDSQWVFLVSVLDEDWLATAPQPVYIPARVRDFVARTRPALPGGNLDDLLAKLEAMPYVQLVALLDEVERRVAAAKRPTRS